MVGKKSASEIATGTRVFRVGQRGGKEGPTGKGSSSLKRGLGVRMIK